MCSAQSGSTRHVMIAAWISALLASVLTRSATDDQRSKR
jgi:hypothetical protein